MHFLVQQQPAFVKLVRDTFDPTKPSVVLIHGAANTHRVWDEILTAITHATHNILAIDLPGHGATFADAKTSIEGYADWLINLLDNGAINDATLIGHSMGSLIALDCARRYPARVTALMLIGTAAPMPVAAQVLTLANDDIEAAYDTVTRASFYVAKNDDGTWPVPSVTMTAYRQALSESQPNLLANDMNACNNYAIDSVDLSSIHTPTLILIGEKDRMTSVEAGLAVSQQLANATHAVIANVGHMMMLEATAKVAQLMNDFLVESYQPPSPQS
jgi:pimeloyl-ACP methyl ester carboxylesterase